MQARLKVVQENANLKQVKLLPTTIIGRSAECHLKIASTEVSRKHCRITVTEQDVLIEDLNSSNGTYVNQERIAPGTAVSIAPGTTLHVGPATFIVEYTPPVTLESMPTTVIKSFELPSLPGSAGRPESPPTLSVDAAVAQASGLAELATVSEEAQTVSPVEAACLAESGLLDADLPGLAATPAIPMADSAEPAADPVLAQPVLTAPVLTEPVIAPPMALPVPELPRVAAVLTASPVATPVPVVAVPAAAVPMTAIPVAAPVVARALPVAPAAGQVVAKPVVAQPVAAPVSLPPAPPAEATVMMGDPGQATVSMAPPAAPPGMNFDFMETGTPAATAVGDFAGLQFPGSEPAAALPALTTGTPPASRAAKPAPARKSLFGLFGKKEKTATISATIPETRPAAPVQGIAIPPVPAAASEVPFVDFGIPEETMAPPVVAEPPVSLPPAAAPSALPAASSDDPFAFLK